ncbi:MAG: carboxyl transferase domain-containing protein [Planctomycetota bacterium]
MDKILSKLDTRSADYRENLAAGRDLVEELTSRLGEARKGGPKKAHERQKNLGKISARERLELLLDPDAPFLELSPLAAFGMYDSQAPAAGILTGLGRVHGREVLVIANDPSVKGGTYFPMTVKKHLRAQDIARENHLPCVYIVDSGGAYLPMQDEVFPDRDHFGRIFFNQARMSAMGIPQVSVVMGYCTAGGAYVPAMSDETVIVKQQGTIFIGGPPLVKAATGVDVTPEELGGAEIHTSVSGVADHLAFDARHAMRLARNIIENLGKAQKVELHTADVENPAYDPEELLGIVPPDLRKPFDVREVIARIVDGSRFHEFKEKYGPTLVTGFARIMGYPVGILANNGVLFSESALKGAHFMTMCNIRRVPILFFQNITGFIVGREYESGGIAKDGAKMVHALANADVPKFTVILGASHGAGNYGMCGRAYQPRLLWSWPTARISVMGAEQAANVLLTVKADQARREGRDLSREEEDGIRDSIRRKYDREGNPYTSTARLWDDGILDPRDTRSALALAISMSLNAPIPPHRVGVFRM